MRLSTIRVMVSVLALGMLAGCASYYRVTNPAGGQVYYTQQVNKLGQGAVKFKDARTGSEITIQNSEVSPITETEYQEGLRLQSAKTVQDVAATKPTAVK